MKRIAAILLAFTIYFSIAPCVAKAAEKTTDIWDGSIATEFTSGSGSRSDPYCIATAEELALLASLVNEGLSEYENACYRLTSDLDLNNLNWTPIGEDLLSNQLGISRVFKGRFEGQGHTIFRMNIVSAGTNKTGLFGATVDAAISGLNLAECNIELSTNYEYYNGTYCGGLIGLASNTTVIGCSVQGMIDLNCTSSIYGGGLIGLQSGGTVSNSSANVGITENAKDNTEVYMGYCGGLIGSTSGAVSKSSASGNLTIYMHAAHAGGLVGYSSANITDSFATGNVNCSSRFHRYGSFVEIGGLVGSINESNTISYCYASGNVEARSGNGNAYAGGILGREGDKLDYFHTILENCFSTGNVTAVGEGPLESFSGALIGDMQEKFTYDSESRHFSNCFCNQNAKIIWHNSELASNDVGVQVQLNNFKSSEWISKNLKFDCVETWNVQNVLPTLRPQIIAISVEQFPHKRAYLEGAIFDTTGLVVCGIYNDGTQDLISTGFKYECDLSQEGDRPVIITYQGLETFFNISVVPPNTIIQKSAEIVYSSNCPCYAIIVQYDDYGRMQDCWINEVNNDAGIFEIAEDKRIKAFLVLADHLTPITEAVENS